MQRGNRSFGGRSWQCNRTNFREGKGAGRGRNMTAPAWMQQQNGFGNFDQNSGGAGAPPHVHHYQSSSSYAPTNMTSEITDEELSSPATNQTPGISASVQRDYQRDSQQRGYCRDPTRTEVEQWLNQNFQKQYIDTPDKMKLMVDVFTVSPCIFLVMKAMRGKRFF